MSKIKNTAWLIQFKKAGQVDFEEGQIVQGYELAEYLANFDEDTQEHINSQLNDDVIHFQDDTTVFELVRL